MSLSNILEHVKRKGQILQKTSQSERSLAGANTNSPEPLSKDLYKYNNGGTRPVDPVVARLKAARKLENEKKEQEAREKKGLGPKKPKATTKSSTSNGSRSKNGTTKNNVGFSSGTAINQSPSPSKKPVKKMNFNDLMKKASKIDQSKLSVSIKPKAKSPDAHPTARKYKPVSRASSAPIESNRKTPRPKENKPTASKLSFAHETKPFKTTAPLPIRKPSSKLEEKLKHSGKKRSDNSRYENSRVHGDYDEDEDSESFIVSDEDEIEESAPDYDRDEIWAIFNKGKKRAYYDRYDDDSGDDMEATGAEIWEEEMKSKRRAELEDRRELEEQQRLAALKKARKMNQK